MTNNNPVSATPSGIDQQQLQKDFLKTLIECDLEDISYGCASQLRDATSTLEGIIEAGLELNTPFELDGLEDLTPLGFAASVLSDISLQPHTVAGRAKDDIPSPQEAQVHQVASLIFRNIVSTAAKQAQQSGKAISTSTATQPDEFQCLSKLTSPGDHELINRLVQAGLAVEMPFIEQMSINDLHRACKDGSPLSQKLKIWIDQAGPNGKACKSAINDPLKWAGADDSTLKEPAELLRECTDRGTLTAALAHCSKSEAPSHLVTGLIGLGADPLGERSQDVNEKSILWHLLKDRSGVDGAMSILESIPGGLDPHEEHDGMSILYRSGCLRNDELVKAMAQLGATYLPAKTGLDGSASPADNEAQWALINAAEWGMPSQVLAALDQGADINGVLKQGITQRTALIAAGLHDKAEVVAVLLAAGADLDQKILTKRLNPGQPWSEVETDFVSDVLRLDSVNALLASANHIGYDRLMDLQAPPSSKRVQELIKAAQAKGSIPSPMDDAGDDADIAKGLASILELAKKNGTKVIGIANGSSIAISPSNFLGGPTP